jgi:hypothetical protein
MEGVKYKKEKIFKEKKEAIAWEADTKRLKDDEFLNQKKTTLMVYSLLDWANDYIAFSNKFSEKTVKEKMSAFKRFFKMFDDCMSVKHFTSKMSLDYLAKQFEKRSGNATNKDRKNLVAAWNYGKKFIPEFPSLNPFQVVDLSY